MLRSLRTLVRSRPWTTALVLFGLALAGTGTGLYGYALYQWHAAQAALREDRPTDARARIQWCLTFWPRSADVHLLAARAARLTGDYPAAETHLKTCTRLNRGATEASQLEYLLMRAQTGEEDEVAAALFNYVDHEYHESPLILQTLARAYMHRLRYGPAYACINRWAKLQPDSAKPYHWKGWVLERLNNPRAAMQDYERALELDPELVPVRLRVAEMLLEDSHPVKAAPHLERLHRQFPGQADVMARLGQCRFLQGQSTEARKLMEAAVGELPDDSALLVHLAKLELQEDRPARAEEWLRKALKADPSDPEAQFTLATCLQHQGRRREADEALARYKKTKALLDRANGLLRDEARQPSNDPGPAAEIGAALLAIGQKRQGMYWLDQALARDPGHTATHKVLAEHFESNGQPERAASHRRWLAKKPSSGGR
jgi:tetratricopeptide (TPR) repeat protein